MALVKDCGAVPGTNEHFIATTIFTKKVERRDVHDIRELRGEI
jgi:hypothetical protein